MSETLFPVDEVRKPGGDEPKRGMPRVLRPNRAQVELRPTDLEALLPEDHRARAIWEFVSELDLSPWYDAIEAVEGHAGRPAIDPAVLLSLWVYAIAEGVGSARALERLCEQHDAYRWICGGVSVSYRTLAAFRVAHEERLNRLLTEIVVRLMDEGLITLTRVSQDGMRVRASAGAASFRSRKRLRELRRKVGGHVEALRRELEDDPGATSRRERAARERAACERKARVARALAKLEEEAAAGRETERASTTDPDARVMKMADGGFRPAYNVQLAATGGHVIVGVDLTDAGSDQHRLVPMLDQLERRYGQQPGELLVDGGFAALGNIDAADERGCRVYAPPMKPRDGTRNPYQPRPGDSPAVARWRKRMGRPAAKEKYKERAATSECINAQARNRGLLHFLVRGLERVRAATLLHAVAHDVLRAISLRAVRAEAAA